MRLVNKTAIVTGPRGIGRTVRKFWPSKVLR